MFTDFDDLIKLIATWLKGFQMANEVGEHHGGHDPEVIAKLDDLLIRYKAMATDGFSDSALVDEWMLDLAAITTSLWD